MSVLYITSQKQGSGKTTFCAAIAGILNDAGKVVHLVKPYPQGELGQGSDNAKLSKLIDNVVDPPSDKTVDALIAVIKDADSKCDWVIVEASPPLRVEDQVLIVQELGAKVLVISVPSEIDSVAGFSKNFQPYLAGVIINQLPKYARTQIEQNISRNFIDAHISLLGMVPEDRTLLSLSVSQICERLGGRVFGEEQNFDALVEHFMVGGFGMDPGQYSFSTRSKKAVVVRGDRPDVQMSALGTEMECFIMTNGIDPIEYVKYEATEEQVAIIIVDSNTLDTMENISGLQHLSEFDHPDKLSRAKELINDHVDMKSLISMD